MSVTRESTEPAQFPGWIAHLGLRALADQERYRHAAEMEALRRDREVLAAWLQAAVERVFGLTADVSRLPTDADGRPHLTLNDGIESYELAPIPPGADGVPNLDLISRCRKCGGVARQSEIRDAASLGQVIAEGLDGRLCERCGWEMEQGARHAA